MKTRNAFTLLELTFVIVIIGILAAVAVPKLAATRDDAIIARARDTVASVRSSMAAERQKRILRGDYTAITSLHNPVSGFVFDAFDGNASNPVLEYPKRVCSAAQKGCWKIKAGPVYSYVFPFGNAEVDFNITANRFDCDHTDDNCKTLTE